MSLSRAEALTDRTVAGPSACISGARDHDLQTLLVALLLGGAVLMGMAADSALLTFVGASVAIFAALMFPSIGLATLAFMVPLQPPEVFSPFGFHAVLVVGILGGCILRLPIERPRLRMNALVFLLLGWLAFVTVQVLPELLTAYSDTQGAFVLGQFKQILIGFGAVMAAGLVLSQRSPYPSIAAGLVSAALAGILAIVSAAGLDVGSPLSHLMAESIGGLRASGPFGNSNYFGFFAATAITAAAGLVVGGKSRRARSLALAACALLGVALALSYSRGALIAFAVGAVSLAFLRNRFLGFVVLGAALVAIVVGYPAFLQLRLDVTFGSIGDDAYLAAELSDLERARAGLAGIQLFLSSPMFGVGFGQFHFLTASIVGDQAVTFSHNWYVNVLAEQGIVGGFIWALLVVAIVRSLRSRPVFPRSVGAAVLVVYLVGSLFAEPPTSFQSSGFALLLVTAALVSDWSVSSMDHEQPIRAAPTPTFRPRRQR